ITSTAVPCTTLIRSQVAAGGGTPVQVTQPDRTAQEGSHRFPWLLPDGRHFLYTASSGEKSAVYVADLDAADTAKNRHKLLDVERSEEHTSELQSQSN